MELKRLATIVSDRWVSVLLIAILGFVTAIGFTRVANEALDPVFEAVIRVRFEPGSGETIEDVGAKVEDQQGRAQLAARDLLSTYTGASIVADTASGRLIFIAQGSGEDQARTRVEALTEAYFDAGPGSGGELNEQIASYEDEITDLQAEIGALQPSLSAEELALVAQHDLLDRQIGAVQDRIVALTVSDVLAGDAEQAENDQRREELESLMLDLQAQKAELAPRPISALSTAENLRLGVLQRRMEILRLDYEQLALRSMGVTSESRVEPVVVTDMSPEPMNPFVNGAIGLAVSSVLAIVVLAFLATARKEVWLGDDLDIPFLGAVPHRKPNNEPIPLWYDVTEGGKRKEIIQAVRNTIEGALEGTQASLAIVGLHVQPHATHTLAIDLAASFASAGRRVLLLDADFSEPTGRREYEVDGSSFESVMQLPSASSDSLDEGIIETLDRVSWIRSDLAVMPAGRPPLSLADEVAGHQVRALLDQAQARFDLVLVVAGNAQSAAAQVLVQRVGRALMVIKPGKTTARGLDTIVSDFSYQRARLVGGVLTQGPSISISLPRGLTRDSRGGSHIASVVESRTAGSEERESPPPIHDGYETSTTRH